MKRAILTTHLGSGAVYWIDRLVSTGAIDAIILQRPEPRRGLLRLLARWIKHAPKSASASTSSEYRIFRGMLDHYRRCHHLEWRGPEEVERRAKKAAVRTLYTSQINQDETVSRLLKESKADFTFVLGGRIIRTSTLAQFRGTWVNGHGGLLPHYRGLASEYWAIRNGDLDRIGATIHQLTAKIDHGLVLASSTINVQEAEKFSGVVARSHANLIHLYLEVARGLLGGSIDFSNATPLNEPGAYYSNPKDISYADLWDLTVTEVRNLSH